MTDQGKLLWVMVSGSGIEKWSIGLPIRLFMSKLHLLLRIRVFVLMFFLVLVQTYLTNQKCWTNLKMFQPFVSSRKDLKNWTPSKIQHLQRPHHSQAIWNWWVQNQPKWAIWCRECWKSIFGQNKTLCNSIHSDLQPRKYSIYPLHPWRNIRHCHKPFHPSTHDVYGMPWIRLWNQVVRVKVPSRWTLIACQD